MFNLADYETVDERLDKFWKSNPDGRISTELEVYEDNRFIVKAYIYKNLTDSVAFATGYAEEKVTDRGVNSNFALPNCETSSIGRALANGGFAAKGKRPSAEEMAKVNRTMEQPKSSASSAQVAPKRVASPTAADIAVAEEKDYWTTPIGDSTYQKPAPVTLEKAMETVTAILGTTEALEAPQCEHGHMTWKDGSKNNRAWGGYFCSQSSQTNGFGKGCPTVWYNMSSAGTWEPQKARV